jgi:hypothetical protein
MANKSWYFLKVNGNIEQVEYSYENDGPNEEWNNIPSSQFLSVDEIAEHQLKQLTIEDLRFFATVEKSELIMMHHSYGRWIRNSYGLWHPKNPFVVPNDLGDGHPDGLSMLTIEAIYKRCTAPRDAFKDAMSII